VWVFLVGVETTKQSKNILLGVKIDPSVVNIYIYWGVLCPGWGVVTRAPTLPSVLLWILEIKSRLQHCLLHFMFILSGLPL
jgi:hypothetical protein